MAELIIREHDSANCSGSLSISKFKIQCGLLYATEVESQSVMLTVANVGTRYHAMTTQHLGLPTERRQSQITIFWRALYRHASSFPETYARANYGGPLGLKTRHYALDLSYAMHYLDECLTLANASTASPKLLSVKGYGRLQSELLYDKSDYRNQQNKTFVRMDVFHAYC